MKGQQDVGITQIILLTYFGPSRSALPQFLANIFTFHYKSNINSDGTLISKSPSFGLVVRFIFLLRKNRTFPAAVNIRNP